MPQMGLREKWMCLLREASLALYVVGLAASKQRIYLYLFAYLFISLTSDVLKTLTTNIAIFWHIIRR